MAYYAKVNSRVYEKFNFSVGERQQLKDTNYILWQADLVKLGNELNIPIGKNFEDYLQRVAAEVGALILTPKEAKQEQDGDVTRTLPKANDARFVIETAVDSESTEVDEVREEENDEQGISE
jgi:hypothetical protein